MGKTALTKRPTMLVLDGLERNSVDVNKSRVLLSLCEHRPGCLRRSVGSEQATWKTGRSGNKMVLKNTHFLNKKGLLYSKLCILPGTLTVQDWFPTPHSQ